jgi:hypothetical protein
MMMKEKTSDQSKVQRKMRQNWMKADNVTGSAVTNNPTPRIILDMQSK